MYNRWLWDATRFYLGDNADFSESEYTFMLRNNPFSEEDIDPGPYKNGKNIEDAHVYRPAHPLAQRILEEIKTTDLEVAEITFDYTNNGGIISVLQPYVGKSGVLKISNYTVESFEAEDHIVFSAVADDNEVIDPDVVKKIFQLSATSTDQTQLDDDSLVKLNQTEERYVKGIAVDIAERNGSFFDNEVEKLDNWADDMKKALDLELKRLDIEIKTAKTNAKKIINLDEKLQAQREIKDLEKKRNDMRRRLFETQDDVELKKEKLLETVEAKLSQHANLETIMVIRWRII
jgi:hypothetical protein